MHSLSHNLFDYICDQDGRVLVTLKASYKKELEAKYSQKYPGCPIYYEKKIRHTKLWRNQTLLLQLENIIVVDHLGRRHKSIILPDFILPIQYHLRRKKERPNRTLSCSCIATCARSWLKKSAIKKPSLQPKLQRWQQSFFSFIFIKEIFQ